VVKHWQRAAQRSGGWPLPGSVQGQVGRSSEQPGLAEDVPAHGGGGWNHMIIKVPFNPYHSMILCSFCSETAKLTWHWACREARHRGTKFCVGSARLDRSQLPTTLCHGKL